MGAKPDSALSEPADRSGCPEVEKIKAYAGGQFAGEHNLEEHVRKCQWCAEELREHLKSLEWERFFKKSTNLSFVVGAALVLAVALRSCH